MVVLLVEEEGRHGQGEEQGEWGRADGPVGAVLRRLPAGAGRPRVHTAVGGASAASGGSVELGRRRAAGQGAERGGGEGGHGRGAPPGWSRRIGQYSTELRGRATRVPALLVPGRSARRRPVRRGARRDRPSALAAPAGD